MKNCLVSIDLMEQTALNLIAIAVFSITLSVFITPLLQISPYIPALATLGLLGIFTVDTLTLKNRGTTLLLHALSPSEYKQRVLHHEAGHFLVAYILGIPITGYSLGAWEALKKGQEGIGGVEFDTADLGEKVRNFKEFPAFLERIGTVWMAGIAAESIIYGRAEGGENDRLQLKSALKLAGIPESSHQLKERYSLLQAKSLIEKHRPAYDELVTAMNRRAPVEECCRIIGARISRDNL